MSNEVVAYAEKIGALSIVDIRAQVNLIQHVMKEVMQDGEHYGSIPGVDSKKKSLFKSGAEKLCLTFRMDPQYESVERQEGNHLTVKSKCTLYHINSGQRLGSGEGSCSTKESRYAYRKSARKCPHCQSEAIIKGKEEYGGGWVCFKKKGGCGAKFSDGDSVIESQAEGRVPNEDVADQYNTVLKMANKRSLVAAVLNATAASDIFTQDIEDLPVQERVVQPVPPAVKDVLEAIAKMTTKPEREAAKAIADKLVDPAEVEQAEAAWKARMDTLKKPAASKDQV